MPSINFDQLFGGMENASAENAGGGPPKLGPQSENEPPIDCVFRVVHVDLKPSDQYNATYLICEFEVVQSDDDRARVGGTYSWTHDVTNKFFGLSGAKNFLAAVIGYAPESDDAKGIGKDHVKAAVADDQPLKGRLAAGRFGRKRFKNGNTGIVASFAPVEQDAA